jgi:hypothetical protein
MRFGRKLTSLNISKAPPRAVIAEPLLRRRVSVDSVEEVGDEAVDPLAPKRLD